MITKTTDETFLTDVLMQPTKVVVEFWSDTCNPCKMLAPILESIAESGVNVVTANVAENEAAVSQYGIRAVPTIIVFEDGKATKTFNAAMKTKAQILQLIG